jgi:hypothetical protein
MNNFKKSNDMEIGKIRNIVYTWGFYPALCLLKEQEQLENYELCAKIKTVLDEISKGREWYLSGEVCNIETTFKKIIQEHPNIEVNMDYYISEFKNQIMRLII